MIGDVIEIVLFHHALGLTDGVHALADGLRGAGHVVHLPDLYEGRSFTTLDDGVAHAEEIGFGELVERGVRAVESLPTDVVYAGISLGVLPAQRLAQTRPGAAGALLLEACVPLTEFSERWPAGVPVQIHGMDHDPFFAGEGDVDAARALVADATGSGTPAELHLYPGDRHLFTDRTLPSYDEAATALVVERALALLSRLA